MASWNEEPDLRRPGLKEALRALGLARRRPTEADAPPVSTFPMTPAARAAIRYSKMKKRGEDG